MEPDRTDAVPPALTVSASVARATAERITALLTFHGASFRVHEHPPAATVSEAAARLPFPAGQFLKTLAFVAEERAWILAALRGNDRIDYRKLATAVGVRRADLRQPGPVEVVAQLGMSVGGVCPFPTSGAARVLIDLDAARLETVYCGIGRDDRTLELALRDLIRIVDARVVPIARNGSD